MGFIDAIVNYSLPMVLITIILIIISYLVILKLKKPNKIGFKDTATFG